ncbi:MAG TPA: hypothetical protein VGK48_22135 [Terriglobia bacterium]|jgi:hypothetical protein
MRTRRWSIIVSLALVFATSVPFARAAETLPSQLSDQEFWKLSSESSEPDGTFRSDNLLSNESYFEFVIPRLSETAKQGRVYMGVGPEQNFTYISSLKPKMVFIVDIRRGNLDLQLIAISNSPSTDEIYTGNLTAIKDQLMKKHGYPLSDDDLMGLEWVYGNFSSFGPRINYGSSGRGGFGSGVTYADLMTATDADGVSRSYLANEENFNVLKALETNNLIVPVVGNFAGPKAIRAVGKYLKDKEGVVSAFSLSNVEMYLEQDGIWDKFCRNVAALPLDNYSTFIRSARGGTFGLGSGLNSDLGTWLPK